MRRLMLPLLHDNLGTELLHCGNDLLGILLGYVLLHHLRRALDKLLAVDQAQTEQTLDLLNDLGLGGGVELLELQCEKGLLGGGRCSILGLFSGRGGGGGGGSEAAYRHVGDVELAL